MLGQTVRVRKEHIREGRKGSTGYCPVALAIKEAFPNVRKVQADLDIIQIDDVHYETPERVEQFMNRFDFTTNRESISGFKFTIVREAPVYFRPR